MRVPPACSVGVCLCVCMNPKPTLSCLPQPALSKQQGGTGLCENTEETGNTGIHTHTHTHACDHARQQTHCLPKKHSHPTRPTLGQLLSESLGDPSSLIQQTQSTSAHTESHSSVASTRLKHAHTLLHTHTHCRQHFPVMVQLTTSISWFPNQ